MNTKTIAVISLIVSIVSVIFCGFVLASRYPEDTPDFNYMGVIIGILSLLVTALIGAQVGQYVFVDRKIERIASKITRIIAHKSANDIAKKTAAKVANSEIDNMLNDIRTISRASTFLFDAKTYRLMGQHSRSVHHYMLAAQEYLSVENKKFSSLLIEDVFQQILNLPERYKPNGHLLVYKEYLDGYKKMVADIDSPLSCKIQELLSQAASLPEGESKEISCFYFD